MRRRGAKKGADEAEVNMTPMLDIVFIMLIFFIVTANIITFRGMDMMQPPDDNSDNPPPNSSAITVWVDENNIAQVDGRTTEPSGVADVVERVRAEKPGASVIFRIHEHADHWVLVKIRDDLESRSVRSKIEVVLAQE